jgi:hypothetical protein
MLQKIYVVVTHTYWEHFGARPSEYEFNTKAEAYAYANKFESYYMMEDGYYADVYKKSRVVITPEDEAKQLARRELKKSFDWKKDSFDYGIFTFWDGSKELFFINEEEDDFYIYFLSSKEKYNLKYFPMADGESMRSFKKIWF